MYFFSYFLLVNQKGSFAYQRLFEKYLLLIIYVFIWLYWVLVVACSIFYLAHVGSDSDKELNPGPLHWENSLSHWTTRDVPRDF